MTDELSPDVRSLFDAERRRDVDEIPSGAKDRVHAALAASIGVGFGTAAGTGAAAKTAALAKGSGAAAATKLAAASGAAATVAPAATATGGILAKGLAVALVAAMAGTAGTGIYLANKDDKPKPAPAAVAHVVDPAPTFDPRALAAPAPAPTPVVAPTAHVAIAPHVDVTPPKKVETPEEKATRLAGERTVLDAARAAIAKGDGGAALIAIEAHRDRYPDGALVEEREALTVLALAKLGRVDDANEKAARFKAKYPSSLFLGAVEDAIKN
jgi:hypothetical protein